MFEEAGDCKWADAADFWSDGGEIFSLIDFGIEVAFNDTFFAGGASVYKSGAGFYHVVFD